MAQRPVDTRFCTYSRDIARMFVSDISEYGREGHIYYVVNDYKNKSGFTLYGFRILKETQCFYFILGRRVHKDTMKHFGRTPEEAFKKALVRARRYLNILCDRGRNVAYFLQRMDPMESDNMGELRLFEEIAKQHGGGDTIPPRAFTHDAFTRRSLYLLEDDI